MRKYIFIFFIFLSNLSFAQNRGIEIFYGFNSSWSTDARLETNGAQTFGIIYYQPVNKIFRYHAELNHRVRGASNGRLDKNLFFILHRSLLGMKLPLSEKRWSFVHLGVGAYIGAKYHQNQEWNFIFGIGQDRVQPLDEDYKNIDYGLALNYGLGVRLADWLNLNIRGHYDLGFLNLEGEPQNLPYRVRDSGIVLGLEAIF